MSNDVKKFTGLSFATGDGTPDPPPRDGGTFVFRNRFTVRNHALGIDSGRFEFRPTAAHEVVSLIAGRRDAKIKDCDSSIIVGRGYVTHDEALAAGRKWRQITISTFARLGVSLELGDDLSANLYPTEATNALKGIWNVPASEVAYNDRIGLLIYDNKKQPKFFYGSASGIVQTPSGPSEHDVETAINRLRGDWSDELRLAYTLVHSALADSNQETRYILLVTAIEALIPYRKKEGELSSLLEALKPDTDGHVEFDTDTRDSVKKLLDSSQYNSIRQYGLKLAARLDDEYGGKPSKKYFDEVYGTRSALAHGNLRDLPHLSERALAEQQSELRRFVLDILESWTANPTFDTTSPAGGGTAESSPEPGPPSQ